LRHTNSCVLKGRRISLSLQDVFILSTSATPRPPSTKTHRHPRRSRQRASVVECARPSGAVAQCEDCQPTSNWTFPGRGYWRTSHGSRNDTARANKPSLLGLAGGNSFQNGAVSPYSTTLARDSPAPPCAYARCWQAGVFGGRTPHGKSNVTVGSSIVRWHVYFHWRLSSNLLGAVTGRHNGQIRIKLIGSGPSPFVMAKGKCREATEESSQTRQCLVPRQTKSCGLQGRRISPVLSRRFHSFHQRGPAATVNQNASPSAALAPTRQRPGVRPALRRCGPMRRLPTSE
jgi:hypothetical protein